MTSVQDWCDSAEGCLSCPSPLSRSHPFPLSALELTVQIGRCSGTQTSSACFSPAHLPLLLFIDESASACVLPLASAKSHLPPSSHTLYIFTHTHTLACLVPLSPLFPSAASLSFPSSPPLALSRALSLALSSSGTLPLSVCGLVASVVVSYKVLIDSHFSMLVT